MKAAVFADTHSCTTPMVEAIRRCRPDIVIHLGDCERDTEIIKKEFPDIPLYNVCGNCDFAPLAPMEDIVPMGPVKALITHGHKYNVSWGRIDYLVYAAQEAGAQIVMYGHTHTPLYEEMGGVKVLNPGTAGKGSHLTYAIVEVYDNGGITCEIKELHKDY